MNRDPSNPALACTAPRSLTAADIPQAMHLKNAAGWNQTAQDWLLLQELEPGGGFAVEEGGELASTATVITYGQELAWIGMVLTAPHLQRRGHAGRVVSRAIEYALERGVARIGLDATEMGFKLYQRFGFEPRGLVERWERPAYASSLAPVPLEPWTPDPVLDMEAFGANRGRLLRALARSESASVPEGGGFAMGRPGSAAVYFGPCVAKTTSAANILLRWFLGRHPSEPVCWDLLDSNSEALLLAREYGFHPARRLTRMMRIARLAQLPEPDKSLVFATAGLELG